MTGHPEQGIQDRTAGTGLINRTARTGKSGEGNLTDKPGQSKDVRIAIT
jgi:hypothetical protein